ncbi:LysR family substrate-binding domain-containing protein [Bradyrhizobium sp. USDA 10063]
MVDGEYVARHRHRHRRAHGAIVTGSLPLVDCERLALWSERVVVVLPQDHPLAARESICWTDLRGETVLLSHYDPGREFEELLVSKLVAPDDRPKIERHDVSRGIIKSLISMQAGVSLVLESDLGANFAGLVYRDLRDDSGPSRFAFSAYWRANNASPALNAFLTMLAERYPSPRLAR